MLLRSRPVGFSETELRRVLKGPVRKRWDLLSEVARKVNLRGAEAALALAMKVLDYSEFQSFRAQVLRRWAEVDPEAVIKYAGARA